MTELKPICPTCFGPVEEIKTKKDEIKRYKCNTCGPLINPHWSS